MTFDEIELIAEKFFTFAAAILISATVCAASSAEATINMNAGLSMQSGKGAQTILTRLLAVDANLLPG